MSTIPAALTALVQLVTVSLPGVRVEDGPWLNRPEEPDVVVVGWTPDEGTAVEMADTIAGLGSSAESYDVTCLASSWSGETDMAARRARVDAMVEAVRGGLRIDHTLGGVVTRARVGTVSLDQFQTDAGCEAAVVFTVRVDAFRTD